jgi:hypothetical protein
MTGARVMTTPPLQVCDHVRARAGSGRDKNSAAELSAGVVRRRLRIAGMHVV